MREAIANPSVPAHLAASRDQAWVTARPASAGRRRAEAGRGSSHVRPRAPPDFALSESPRYVGRAVVALASDAGRARWNQHSLTSGQLAREYGFTDIDGTRPDVWRFMEEVRDKGLDAPYDGYR